MMKSELQAYLLGELRIAPTASAAEWKVAAGELVQMNLEALTESLPRILPPLDEQEAEAILQALVESGRSEVAPVLAALDSPLVNKSLRKAARRALHLLRTRGVQVEQVVLAATRAPLVQAQEEWRAWYTTPNLHACQTWILERKSRFRMEIYSFLLKEGTLADMISLDAATESDRERMLDVFRKERERMPPVVFVQEIDAGHARWRVFHSAGQAKKKKQPLPQEFAFVRKTLRPPEDSERHPVWRFFNSFDVRAEMQREDPELIAALREPHCKFWAQNPHLVDESLVEEFTKITASTIKLPPSLQAKRENELFQQFVDRRLDENWQDFWRWALQDYAYAWFRHGWRKEAELALYWSLLMDDMQVDRNPFLQVYVRDSILFYLMLSVGSPHGVRGGGGDLGRGGEPASITTGGGQEGEERGIAHANDS